MTMFAADVMTSPVASVAPGARVSEIAALMTSRHIGAVPVCAADGMLVGIVSEADILKPFLGSRRLIRERWLNLIAEGENLSQEFLNYIQSDVRTAADVMRREVRSVVETTPVQELADLLTTHKIRHLPVLREGRLVGIISRADLVAAIARAPADVLS